MSDIKAPAFEIPSLLRLTVDQASQGLENSRFTSVDLVKAYLARIKEVAVHNAVLQVNPAALAIAQELDLERKSSKLRGPLHGLPILVKDNIVTDDELEASAGSFALLGAKPAEESSVIARLRRAGAIILGKTNMSEWANFRGSNISAGWSPRGGQTLGLYHQGMTADGSSSGSAIAASLGLAMLSIGTETWGSILDPSEINNVVGMKPTRGLIAGDGAIPIAFRQDTLGPIGRTVRDVAHLLSSMAGRSEKDPRTWNIPFQDIPDFAAGCDGTNLQSVSIGVARNALNALALPVEESFEKALLTLSAAGARIVDNANFSAADDFRVWRQEVGSTVRSSEFNKDISSYLAKLKTNPNNIRSLEDIIDFTKTNPSELYPGFDIGNFLSTQADLMDVDSPEYKDILDKEAFYAGEGGILGSLDKHNLDVLAFPTPAGITSDLFSKLGLPAISVPLGFWPENTPVESEGRKPYLIRTAPGIPYSIMFVGKAYSDGVLLRVAHAFEQLTKVREQGPQPINIPSTELIDVVGQRKKL